MDKKKTEALARKNGQASRGLQQLLPRVYGLVSFPV